jgi:putative transposase
MEAISYARHQFPVEIIRHATWLYLRFTVSYRDVEELLAERGIETSYETVRRWVLKFGPAFARNRASMDISTCCAALFASQSTSPASR